MDLLKTKTLLKKGEVYEVINMFNPASTNEKPCCEVRGGDIEWHSTTFKFPIPTSLDDIPVDLEVEDGSYFTTDYGTKHKYIGYDSDTDPEVLLSGFEVKQITGDVGNG